MTWSYVLKCRRGDIVGVAQDPDACVRDAIATAEKRWPDLEHYNRGGDEEMMRPNHARFHGSFSDGTTFNRVVMLYSLYAQHHRTRAQAERAAEEMREECVFRDCVADLKEVRS